MRTKNEINVQCSMFGRDDSIVTTLYHLNVGREEGKIYS